MVEKTALFYCDYLTFSEKLIYKQQELRFGDNMIKKIKTQPPLVCMSYMSYGPWFEATDDEVTRRRKMLEHALEELGSTTVRLRHVTDRLIRIGEDDLTEENVSWCVEELEYHGEYFLTTAYEIQDRLAGLLAILTESPKDILIGKRRAFTDARIPRYVELKKTMPRAAEQFLALESRICSFVKLRNKKTHEGSLHFEFLVDGQPYDPEEILRSVKEEAQYGALLQTIRVEVHRFIETHKTDCEAIEKSVEQLEETIREREKLDE